MDGDGFFNENMYRANMEAARKDAVARLQGATHAGEPVRYTSQDWNVNFALIFHETGCKCCWPK